MTIPDEVLIPIRGFFVRNWVLIIIIATAVISGYASVVFLGNDNVVEENVEKIIEAQTGVKVELTP